MHSNGYRFMAKTGAYNYPYIFIHCASSPLGHSGVEHLVGHTSIQGAWGKPLLAKAI